MQTRLIIACKQGVVIAEQCGTGWRLRGRYITDVQATCITNSASGIYIGTRDGVYVSLDDGENWKPCKQGLNPSYVRWISAAPGNGGKEIILAGTEPASIQKLHPDSEIPEWESVESVTKLRDKHQWSLPYSPRAGCVRDFEFPGKQGYAAVEVGGLLSSHDGGETWELAQGSTGDPSSDYPCEPRIWPDVHSVTLSPKQIKTLWAPTGKGLYRSKDGAKHFENVYPCYIRAVLIDASGKHVVAGPADGVTSNGRIEVSNDAGTTWKQVEPVDETVWSDAMIERFVTSADSIFAVRSDGNILCAPLGDTSAWRLILPEVSDAKVLICEQ